MSQHKTQLKRGKSPSCTTEEILIFWISYLSPTLVATYCTQMEGHTFSNAVRCTGVCKNRQEALFMASAEQNRFTYFLRRFKSLGMSRLESNIVKPVLFTALYTGNFYVWTKCIMLSPWLLFGLCSWKSQHRAKQQGMGQIRIRKHLNLMLAGPCIIIQFKQINQQRC